MSIRKIKCKLADLIEQRETLHFREPKETYVKRSRELETEIERMEQKLLFENSLRPFRLVLIFFTLVSLSFGLTLIFKELLN